MTRPQHNAHILTWEQALYVLLLSDVEQMARVHKRVGGCCLLCERKRTGGKDLADAVWWMEQLLGE